MNIRRIDKRLRNFDWNLLYTYVVIVEEKSITQAANRLYLRQPTVSNALKRLETYLDCKLIERSKATFTLTEHGKILYEKAKYIADNVGSVIDILQGSEANISGEIVIAMASHVVFKPLDDFLTEFHKNYPDIRFSIEIMNSNDVAGAVKRKEVTAGICLVHRKRRGIHYQHLYREYFGFYCGPPHPLFGKESLTLKDIRLEHTVSFNTDRLVDVLRPVALLRSKAQLAGAITGSSSNLEEVRRMISCGMGYGPLPWHIAEPWVKSGKLWQLPPYRNLPAVDAYILNNKSISQTQAEQTFLTEITKMVGGLNKEQKDLKIRTT